MIFYLNILIGNCYKQNYFLRSQCTIAVVKPTKQRKKPTFALNFIGPHDFETLCIIFGTLLGDAHIQKRRNSTRVSFRQCAAHKEHLFSLWEYFNNKGYTSASKPELKTYIHKKTKKRIDHYAFDTYSYASFNWIKDLFYKDKVKIVPNCIADYLSPRALAIWIMDDGERHGGGVRLNTQDFTKEEILFLGKVLFDKYKLKCTLHKSKYSERKKTQQYRLYISAKCLNILRSLVVPYLVPSMFYKVGL